MTTAIAIFCLTLGFIFRDIYTIMENYFFRNNPRKIELNLSLLLYGVDICYFII